jgi:hypothetical protein
MMVLLCVFIGACQQNSSQPSGNMDNPTTEALEPGGSNVSASAMTDEQTHTTEQENLSEIDTEACCENEDPPNAVAGEVLPTAENEIEQRTNENTETEED